MAEPKQLGEDLPALLARAERITAAARARDATPEGARARAAAAALDADRARRAAEAVRATREHRIACVGEAGTRAVALREHVGPTAALRAVRRALAWRRAHETGLFLCVVGPTGVGKTAALARAVYRHGGTALVVPAPTIAATPDNGWSANRAAWEAWENVDLLAIDELGSERPGRDEDGVVTLRELIATRLNRGRATLASANLDATEFHRRYVDTAIASRLRAQGPEAYALVGGPDLRGVAT